MRTLFFLMLMTNLAWGQHNLVLQIEGIRSNKGKLCYAIYTSEDTFLSMDKVYKAGAKKAAIGNISIDIKDLPHGYYAIAIYHDENENDKLDTNMLGIPKEQIAFSIGKMKMFGPPKFDECAFDFNSNMKIKIRIN